MKYVYIVCRCNWVENVVGVYSSKALATEVALDGDYYFTRYALNEPRTQVVVDHDSDGNVIGSGLANDT